MANLRYFNVVGAAAPELRDTGVYDLVPLAFRSLRESVAPRVFGADCGTPDGTSVRDYVDVQDLAGAHVRAAEALSSPTGASPTRTSGEVRAAASSRCWTPPVR